MFPKVKVDFSIARKSKDGRPGMPGEFAVYERKNIFSPWIEIQTYAMLEWAKRDAENRAQLPVYYYPKEKRQYY